MLFLLCVVGKGGVWFSRVSVFALCLLVDRLSVVDMYWKVVSGWVV